MALPRFSAGERVSLSHPRALHAPGGVYQIIRPLPSEGRPYRYRVKAETEAFERIVDEARLGAIASE